LVDKYIQAFKVSPEICLESVKGKPKNVIWYDARKYRFSFKKRINTVQAFLALAALFQKCLNLFQKSVSKVAFATKPPKTYDL
jgi:hypothetical protein